MRGGKDQIPVITMVSMKTNFRVGFLRDNSPPTVGGRDSPQNLELWKLHWFAGPEERETVEIIGDFLCKYEATRDIDLLERAIGLAESLALGSKKNDKPLKHLLEMRQIFHHRLEPQRQVNG